MECLKSRCSIWVESSLIDIRVGWKDSNRDKHSTLASSLMTENYFFYIDLYMCQFYVTYFLRQWRSSHIS
jgi:hypothetical protein